VGHRAGSTPAPGTKASSKEEAFLVLYVSCFYLFVLFVLDCGHGLQIRLSGFHYSCQTILKIGCIYFCFLFSVIFSFVIGFFPASLFFLKYHFLFVTV
jgi:hypothetical protein